MDNKDNTLKKLKNRNLLVIGFEILVIIVSVIGITLATSRYLNDRSTTILTSGEYSIDYRGDIDITANNLEPISDNLINIDSKDNVVRVEFSLRGTRDNNTDNNLIYDVMLSNIDIDCSLLNEYTKWNLYKNGNLLSSGNLDPSFDKSILTDNMRLTNIQEDLPMYNQDYDNYVLIFWISESCDNIATCKRVDQSSILNSKMNMKVYIAIYGGAKKAFERVPSYDGTCANKPVLDDAMIPVTYRDGNFIVADKENQDINNLWYNYKDSKWANVVITNNKDKYNSVGTVIDNNDVLGYFVWIPRYRYKLWNVETNITDSYNAYDNGIDIIFERGLGRTDNEYLNNNYLTHPVFNDNLLGIWVSKYEISNGNRFISGVEAIRNNPVDNYISIMNNISNNYNLTSMNSHMTTSLEWGSVLYLSHSKYGVCKGDGCSSISINGTYISGNDKGDTTTRNVYGIYDMAGASSEYVLADNSGIGNATTEVTLANSDTWYQGHGLLSDREYYLRGGINRGLFYFGDISMSDTNYSARATLINK